VERLARNGDRFDTLTVLYATAPLRGAADIRATLALLDPGRCDFAMAVAEFVQPVHQALRADGAAMRPVFPEIVERRAASVGPYYAGNGSTYSVAVEAFLRERRFYGEPLRGHIMPRERSIDIDTAADLELAKLYGARLGLGRAAARRKNRPPRKPAGRKPRRR
jgi:N-acylneuraminate cytidylyltransferase